MSVYAIPRSNLFVPERFGKMDVSYNGKEFFIIHGENKSCKVQSADLSINLREISLETLQACLDFSYVSIRQIGQDYGLTMQGRIKGGGPIAGYIGYCATKALCYGTALAAVGAGIVTTAGTIAGPVGAALAGGALTTVEVSTGTGIIAGAIATSTTGTLIATEITTATIAAGGTLATVTAAVETASLGVGALLTAIPFLP